VIAVAGEKVVKHPLPETGVNSQMHVDILRSNYCFGVGKVKQLAYILM
jgi:hypothetical protein